MGGCFGCHGKQPRVFVYLCHQNKGQGHSRGQGQLKYLVKIGRIENNPRIETLGSKIILGLVGLAWICGAVVPNMWCQVCGTVGASWCRWC